MRKIVSLLLLGAVMLSFSGCKKKQQNQAAETSQPETVTSAVSEQDAQKTEFTKVTLPKPSFHEETVPVLDAETEPVIETEYTGYSYDAGELTEDSDISVSTEGVIDRDGVFTSKDDVALYLYTYHELPSNFITKKEAQKLGWEGGSLEPYAPGHCIGGTYFGNYEGTLPEKNGREYHECDIDTLGKKSRGAKRIVYSNDGLIYYTEDHYSTFVLLYGEE